MDSLSSTMCSATLGDDNRQLPNFPLPQELRDQIYGYLLSSQNVRDGNTYHFHTNILAVNRAIYEEAESFLYKHNVFVIMSYQWTSLERKAVDGIPFITHAKTKVGKLKHYSLRAHLKLVPRSVNEANRDVPKDAPLRWALILEADVRSLCAVFQLTLYLCHGSVLYIQSAKGEALQVTTRPNPRVMRAPLVILELFNTKHRSIDGSFRSRITRPFTHLISEDIKVSMKGAVADHAQFKSAKALMTPSPVWAVAKKWHFFETIKELKGMCDSILLSGHHRKAYELLGGLYMEMKSMSSHADVFPDASHGQDVQAASNLLMFDMLTSLGWLAARLGESKQLIEIVEAMLEMCARDNFVEWIDPATAVTINGLQWLAVLYGREPKPTVKVANVIESLEEVTKLSPDAYIEHDLRLLKATSHPNEVCSVSSYCASERC